MRGQPLRRRHQAGRRPFGARLTAVIALLSGRYRLSRREVRQLLQDLWAVRVSLGAVVRQEQAQSAALAPVVEEARAAVQTGGRWSTWTKRAGGRSSGGPGCGPW